MFRSREERDQQKREEKEAKERQKQQERQEREKRQQLAQETQSLKARLEKRKKEWLSTVESYKQEVSAKKSWKRAPTYPISKPNWRYVN